MNWQTVMKWCVHKVLMSIFKLFMALCLWRALEENSCWNLFIVINISPKCVCACFFVFSAENTNQDKNSSTVQKENERTVSFSCWCVQCSVLDVRIAYLSPYIPRSLWDRHSIFFLVIQEQYRFEPEKLYHQQSLRIKQHSWLCKWNATN